MRVRALLPACFLVFTALLVWPLLSIPNHQVLIGGVPALVLYLFGLWGMVVAVLIWAGRRGGGEDAA